MTQQPKQCKYCHGKVLDTYWKNLCSDCAKQLSKIRRMKKEDRLKLMIHAMEYGIDVE